MTSLLAERAAEVVAAAQQLLARRMGAPVKLADPVELGGSGRTIVLRVRVTENTYSLPRTLVAKQVNGSAYHSADTGTDLDSAFLREAVAYQFATALGPERRPGPQLLAYDPASRLLVLTDLGDQSRLSTLLRNTDEAGVTNVLMALAQALGRMHAATVGREEDFVALSRRAGLPQRDVLVAQAETAVEAVPGLLKAYLGLEVPESIVGGAAAAARFFEGGRLRAFSPSDLCPENIIYNDEGVRFLDYEAAGFRDASLDVAQVLIGFPGCLCDFELTPQHREAMIEAWRAEVSVVWPQLQDDDWLARKLLAAELIWVWMSTYWFLPENHGRISEVREHELSIRRSDALARRWHKLADSARMCGKDVVAEFGDRVAETIDARWAM